MSPRGVAAALLTGLAFLLVWVALDAPLRLDQLAWLTFLRLPVEALVLVALLLVLPTRAARVTVVLLGVLLGVLSTLKLLDIGFFEALHRPVDPTIDWTYAGSAVGLLKDSVGNTAGTAIVFGAVLLVLALLVLVPLALLRIARVVGNHRRTSLQVLAVLSVVWLVAAFAGVDTPNGDAVASASTSELAYGQVGQIPQDIRDEREFTRAAAVDPLRSVPRDRLLTGLRGKDVVVAFVESYGQVAVQGTSFSSGVDATLRNGTRRLRAAGFGTRSAFLRSPTFGGISWLAHSTLQSGLWVDNQQRYNTLLDSRRLTLSAAFLRAGWRTVDDLPANRHDWPQGRAFYHDDQVYDSRNVGYAGPGFGYPAIPDQYTLSALRRLELAKPHHRPVMAEVDLLSSHYPWADIPRMVPWNRVGHGSVFDGMPQQVQRSGASWHHPGAPDAVGAAYGRSIRYSLNALTSFVATYRDPNLVLVLLGDHQPAGIVSGDTADRDVPITVVAHDPAVLRRISGWGWQPGMLPSPQAPVWRMDSFRDRFLSAFGEGPTATPPAH
jgi:hypothetical protein